MSPALLLLAVLSSEGDPVIQPSDRLRAALADRYEIVREVGSGGMATVYLATDLRHQRPVALKVLRSELAAALGPDRFLHEIRVTANLQHPHILPLFDSGEADGFLYYVMPFVEGESLRERLAAHGERPVAEAVRLLRDVVDALSAAHTLGIVHRDIKPENILLSGRHALVSDFGVARAVSAATGQERLTTAGVAVGTPAYMAPEQATAAETVDHRADIYTVGVLAYELLTGRPPFAGRTAQAVLAAHLTERPAPVTEMRATVPPALGELVMRCLEKRPADRWQRADEMLPVLEALTGLSGESTPAAGGPVAAASAVRRRKPVVAVAALAIGAMILAAAWLGWSGFGRAPAPAGDGGAAIDAGLIAVVPFRVSVTDPALGYLREGMVDLLHVKLGAVRRSVEPRSLLAAWRSAGGDDAELPLDEVLRLAAGLSAGRVLLGSVVGSSENLTLSAALYEVPRGRGVATASVSGSAAEVATLIDRLTAQIVSLEAGENADRLETLTTTSLPALRAYLDGMAYYRRGRYREATESFVAAVNADSSFALAAIYMFEANSMTGGGLPGVPNAGAIVRAHRDRLGPRDRLFSLARFPDPGSELTLVEHWEAVIPQLHDKPEAWYHFGDMLYHYGAVYGIDDYIARAKDAFSRAVALDSAYFNPLHHLVWIAMEEGDTAFAGRVMRRYLEAEPTGDVAEEFRFRLALIAGDTAALRSLRADFEADLEDMESWPDGRLLVMAGVPNFVPWWDTWEPPVEVPAARFDLGVRAIELAVRRASTPAARTTARSRQAALLWNLGRPLAADSVLQVVAADPGSAAEVDRARIYAAIYWDGDLAAAERAAERLSRLPAPNLFDLYALAEWELRRGRTAGVAQRIARIREPGATATDLLRAQILETHLAHLESWPQADSLALALDDRLRRLAVWEVRARGNLTLVRIFDERGDPTRALAASRRVPMDISIDRDRYASTFLRERGRLAATLGLYQEAIRAYSLYLEIRSSADPEFEPELNQIRAELARLSGIEGR